MYAYGQGIWVTYEDENTVLMKVNNLLHHDGCLHDGNIQCREYCIHELNEECYGFKSLFCFFGNKNCYILCS